MELTELYIGRVEKYDSKINAVVVHDFDRGREAAKAADDALARGEDLGPLHGVPMTIKEAYDIEGLPTTWGVPEFAKNIATSDSDSACLTDDSTSRSTVRPLYEKVTARQ